MNVIDYSLLVQNALLRGGGSAQGAPFAQLALRRVWVLPTNVRSFSGEVWQSLAKSSKLQQIQLRISIRLRLRLRPGIRLREITLLRKGRCCAARDRRSLLPLRSCRCACARAPALTKNAHAGEGFSRLLQKSVICQRGEIALFGIYFAFKARKTFFRYPRSTK